MKLLAWIAERERDYPQAPLDGNTLMQETAELAGDDALPWEAVAKAAARLRKRGYLDWEYMRWPNEAQEPPPLRGECNRRILRSPLQGSVPGFRPLRLLLSTSADKCSMTASATCASAFNVGREPR
jgi:hypothetical protein